MSSPHSKNPIADSRCDTQTFLSQSYHSLDIRITHAGVQVEVRTPTNTTHKKHILLPQPMHNSGTMTVPLHADSMTNSSESSDDDQMVFDIMESHDDSHNKIVCLFSMFVMNCFDEDEDEAQYKHRWGGSPPGRRKKIECDFQGSFEKLKKQWNTDAILQHMGFYVTTENPNVMMRENHNTQSSEYNHMSRWIVYCIYYT